MGNLNNLYISQSFQSLAHLGTNTSLVPGTMTVLQDGIGQSLNISFDGTNISSSGNIYAANLTGSGGSISTGSLMVTGSVNVNVLTFTKGDGSQFSLTVASSGSVTPGTISGSAQITALGFVSSSVTASSLVTASFSGNTLTFTKGDASTFGVVIPDVSGSAGNFVTTSSFNAYTQSNDQRVNSLESNSASVNTSISNINTTTSSLNTSVSNINTFTQSAQISINALNTNSASVNTSITNINSATASLFTSTSLSLTTASFSGNTLTFTKGNGTTFGVVIPDVSGSGATPTGSLLVTASAFTNTITFTKGDGTTFPVTVTTGSLNYVTGSFGAFYDTTTQSGSAGVAYSMKLNNTDISDGVIISGSGGIKVLAAGTYDLQFSAQVLAATGADTVWIWLKKNGTNVADTSTKLVLRNNEADVAAWNFVVAANANDVFELAWQSLGGHTLLFAEAAASNYTAIPSVIATMNRVDVGGGTNLVSTSSFNSYTSSNDQKVSSLINATGSYATTGSNTFTGDQTLIDDAGNFFTISDASGSMMLVAKGFTSASAHISASSAGIGNFIFKTNSNTADTIISGSNNLFVNQQTPQVGAAFKRYLGGSGNIALNAFNVPQISSSMAFSPTMNNNYFGGNSSTLAMRGPVSSSAWTISANNVLGTITIGSSATLHAEKLTSGLTMTANSIAGTLSIVANQSALTGSTTSITNNIIAGGPTLNLSSSAAAMTFNIINDSAFTFTNQFYSSSVGLGSVAMNRNNIAGQGNSVIVVGAQPVGTVTGTSFSDNFIGGGSNILYGEIANARIVGTGAYHNAIRNIIFGNGLIITGSSLLADTTSFGSAFFGRFNDVNGNKDLTAETIFAVGTGTSTSLRKTGFLIDSGSNSYFEGTVNVSGSLLVNGLVVSAVNTGSFATTGSNSFIGNQTITGSLTVSGSGVQVRLPSFDATQGRIKETLSFTGSRFATGIISTSIELENLSSYQFGFNQLATGDALTGTQFILDTNKDSNYTELKLNARYSGSNDASVKLRNTNTGVRTLTVDANTTLVDGLSVQGNIKISRGTDKPTNKVTVGSAGLTVSSSLVTSNSYIFATADTTVGNYFPVVSNITAGSFNLSNGGYSGNIDIMYMIVNPY